jgi:hypothetical protein
VQIRDSKRYALLIVLLIPYLLYLAFVIRGNQGPVDYETFMSIGQRFLDGAPVYTENSYYPLPYVMIFAFFAWLPRALSMALWIGLPLLAALAISGWQPSILLFAPVFAHFTGGQSALFAMLGLWGYRRWQEPDNWRGGAWLALTLLKPQLALVPLAFAGIQWGRVLIRHRRLPSQAVAWGMAAVCIYLPSLLIQPNWPLEWLVAPRPIFERALSGIIPRSLLAVVAPASFAYWGLLLVLSVLLFVSLLALNRNHMDLDLAVLWGFAASPLVHDYDLLQVVPLLNSSSMRWGAVLASLPGFWVIFSAYDVDAAWYVFTFIAPALLAIRLWRTRLVLQKAVLEKDEFQFLRREGTV